MEDPMLPFKFPPAIFAATPYGTIWLNGHGPNHCELDQEVECEECDAAVQN